MILTRPLRIVLPGGTGRLGTILARHFHEQGHAVSTITRYPKAQEWEAIHWDAETMDHWASSIDGADAVINLAGRSLHCYQTSNNRRQIIESRIRTTQLVGQAIAQCARPPHVWLNAGLLSAYPDQLERELTEQDAEAEAGFNASLARQWEQTVTSSPVRDTRKVILRIASVMSPDPGGMFDHLLHLVRRGFGGEIGGGEQFVAWIHDQDFIRAVEFLISQDHIEGPVNLTAPCPIPNHQFMCNLRRAWCTSYFGLALPAGVIRLAAVVLGIQSEPLLRSRRVIPQRLLHHGFDFHFPEWRGACENLMSRAASRKTE